MNTSENPQALRCLLGAVVFFLVSSPCIQAGEAQAPASGTAAPVSGAQAAALTTMGSEERKARAEAYQAKEREWEANAKIVLRSIGSPGGVPVAILDINEEPVLVIAGSHLAGLRVAEIDVANSRVIAVARDESERVFPLLDPRPVDFPSFTPERIERLVSGKDLNRKHERMMPDEVIGAWPMINREGKEAILMGYLRSGLVFNLHPRHEGQGGSMRQLFAEQIRQRSEELREAFLATLTPEQRERFKGGLQIAVRITAPKEEQEAQMARGRKVKADQDAVIAELTAEQRKLYEAWRDEREN